MEVSTHQLSVPVRAGYFLSGGGQDDPMTRLNDTDIWFRSYSYIVPPDTLSQYKISPDIPPIDTTAFILVAKNCCSCPAYDYFGSYW
ncbi:hypothetical protein F4V73_15125 [Morganella psychrotolerans]|uniref:Uncharacterized protein n=1 Tax=Morganella psychrotolerans TaxID=368603 RepID=A0A5M9R1Z2_9GAMM|nr:hypothetical protein F4V73_15125 [Morganella psychrotolerans]